MGATITYDENTALFELVPTDKLPTRTLDALNAALETAGFDPKTVRALIVPNRGRCVVTHHLNVDDGGVRTVETLAALPLTVRAIVKGYGHVAATYVHRLEAADDTWDAGRIRPFRSFTWDTA